MLWAGNSAASKAATFTHLLNSTIYTWQGHFSQAETTPQQAIELHPESAESYHNFGLCYFNQGGVEEAGTVLDLEELQINRQRILESTDSNPSLEPALVVIPDLVRTTRSN